MLGAATSKRPKTRSSEGWNSARAPRFVCGCSGRWDSCTDDGERSGVRTASGTNSSASARRPTCLRSSSRKSRRASGTMLAHSRVSNTPSSIVRATRFSSRRGTPSHHCGGSLDSRHCWPRSDWIESEPCYRNRYCPGAVPSGKLLLSQRARLNGARRPS